MSILGVMAGTAAGHRVAGLTLARSSSSRSMAICWFITFLCSSSARCVDSALDCSALTRQRSCSRVRAESLLHSGLTVPAGAVQSHPTSPALCHKHLLSREVQNEPHTPRRTPGPSSWDDLP